MHFQTLPRYFGGYAAKMQEIGHKELQRLEQSMRRSTEAEVQGPASKRFQLYSRRLLKGLEAKGILRTTVESLNLSIHADQQDVLSAECVCTFPRMTLPASLLLKREEIETLKVTGRSVITAVYHGHAEGRKTFTDAPFDLMYGFRGASYEVDLLSPFEMLMCWSMERIVPPKAKQPEPNAE